MKKSASGLLRLIQQSQLSKGIKKVKNEQKLYFPGAILKEGGPISKNGEQDVNQHRILNHPALTI